MSKNIVGSITAHAVIRHVSTADCDRLAEIYNHYILNTIVTFEEQAVTGADMAQRVQAIATTSLPWLVAEQAGRVVGFAYASRWKGRCAYRYSVESTIYLDPGLTGRGLGSRLYTALFDRLRELGMHSIIGGIALPNPASIALHEKLGLHKVAHFREVGFKFDRWVDVGYWQSTHET
jgi:phosphinothricin acetyltransferase